MYAISSDTVSWLVQRRFAYRASYSAIEAKQEVTVGTRLAFPQQNGISKIFIVNFYTVAFCCGECSWLFYAGCLLLGMLSGLHDLAVRACFKSGFVPW